MSSNDHLLTTSTLAVRCDPRCGGRVSHFIPHGSQANQFRWDPLELDPRDVLGFVPVGGWNDMLLSDEIRFPGRHWNQPCVFERRTDNGAPAARMECKIDGIRLVRKVMLAANRPAMTIASEYTNLSGAALRALHIRTQPIVTPGGRRVSETAVLWPGADGAGVFTLADALRGAGRFGPREQAVASNWWAVSDPASGVTVLIADLRGDTVLQNLVQDRELLMPENVGIKADLAPGETRRMEICVCYCPFDLRPWAGKLDHSRFLIEEALIVGLHLAEPDVAVGAARADVTVICLALDGGRPPERGVLVLRDAAGRALREWAVELATGAKDCAAEAVVRADVGGLPIGRYTLSFALDREAGPESAAVGDLDIVRQTRRQQAASERGELSARLRECEARLAAAPARGFAAAMVRADLDAAELLLREERLDRARRHLHYADEMLDDPRPDPELPGDVADWRMDKEWFRDVEASLDQRPVNSRNPATYGSFHDTEPHNGWRHLDDAQAAYGLTWLYGHPASRYRGDPAALCAAVLAVDELCRSFVDGTLPPDIATDSNINRFTLCPLGEALRILLQWPVAPSRKETWRTQYLRAADYQIRRYGGQRIPEDGYLNQDVMYLLIMRLAHAFSGEARYLAECDYILKMIESQILPDGAFYYLYQHNEVTHYHEIDITFLFRDWMLSGETRSRRLVEQSAPYYPLMVGADGRVEFSSQTWWKHTGARWPRLGAAVVAGLTGDGENQYIVERAARGPAKLASLSWLIYAGLAARREVASKPPVDHRVVMDRNVRGPRGRFGGWSWVGTTAPCRDTLVGCLLAESDTDRAFAMHYAGPQVILGNRDEVNPYLGGVGLAMTPRDYASHSLIEGARAVLGARYGLFPYEHEIDPSKASDWVCEQLWYFDAERMIGLLRLEAIRETKARAVDLSVRFTDYDAVWQKAGTELERTGAGAYLVGPLAARVIEHNLTAEVVQDAWVCAYTGDSPGKGVYARSLADAGRFAGGTAFAMLVEVRPRSSAPAHVTRLREGLGFRVETEREALGVRWIGEAKRVVCEVH